MPKTGFLGRDIPHCGKLMSFPTAPGHGVYACAGVAKVTVVTRLDTMDSNGATTIRRVVVVRADMKRPRARCVGHGQAAVTPTPPRTRSGYGPFFSARNGRSAVLCGEIGRLRAKRFALRLRAR